MPTKLCSNPGCGNPATYRGHCPDHARKVNRDTHPNRSVYNSKRWLMLRRRVLFEQPICACGCGRLTEDVDHIIPIERGGAPFERSNLQGLAKSCHSRKTRKDQGHP